MILSSRLGAIWACALVAPHEGALSCLTPYKLHSGPTAGSMASLKAQQDCDSKSFSLQIAAMYAYIDGEDFSGRGFDDALRSLLAAFRLPGTSTTYFGSRICALRMPG